MVSDYRQLRDTFADPESYLDRTIVCIDIVNSTAMKEQQTTAEWLTSLAWFYDWVTDIAREDVPDVFIKYLGDGIMLVCDTNHTTAAINAVIRILEAINKASTADSGRGLVNFACSAGVSTGDVIGFTTPSGGQDYVGPVVDKAFRLCAAASAKALLIDTRSLGAANTIRIMSKFGKAIERQSDEYTGNVERTMLKGFAQPVPYHEIQWDQQLYGLKSSTVTDSTNRLSSALVVPADRAGRDNPAERRVGEVTFWDADRDMGFARDSQSGEDFHFSSRLLVYRDDIAKLAKARQVVFVSVGEADGRRKRQAAALLLVGEPAEGQLVSMPANKPYGWIRVQDVPGNRHPVYAPIAELRGHKVGDVLSFIVDANEKGAIARRVESALDESA
jgi:class 3 adenylate cyclase